LVAGAKVGFDKRIEGALIRSSDYNDIGQAL